MWVERLAQAGHDLPEVVPPVSAYVPAKRTGDLVYVAGQLPFRDGELVATGKVPDEVSVPTATQCAQQAALNALGAVVSVASPDRVAGIVSVTGYVAAPPSFLDHPTILNGASEILHLAFGDAGKHARAAVGVVSLPLDCPVELQLIAELLPGR